MIKDKIKVTILTGFLGAGKTTLLNSLLAKMADKRNFVIENEFGNTSIDSIIVNKNYNKLFELNNGCICCSLDTELIAVLEQMVTSETVPENLLIEASGVADAGMLASVFMREDVLNYFELQAVIAMVDAENFEDRIEEVPEILRQLTAADFVLINKADMVQESYLEALKKQISVINPFAKIESCAFGNISQAFFEEKIKVWRFSQINLERSQTQMGHGMKSIAILCPHPFDREQLYAGLSITMFMHYHQVYRIKGFVRFEDGDKPVLVQSTGNKLSFSAYENQLSQEPSLVLVFIGKNIERQGLERILNRISNAHTKPV